MLIGVFLAGGYVGAKVSSISKKQEINDFLIRNKIYRSYSISNSEAESIKTTTSPVNCPTKYFAVGLFGQSNSANRIPRKDGLVTKIDNKTFMYDWTTEKCYPFSEPLVGTDGEGKGNLITEAIMDFRKTNSEISLIVIPFGKGGSSVFNWSHSDLSVRLDTVIDRLQKSNISPNLFLWHQGESDAIPEIYTFEKNKAYGLGFGSQRLFYEKALDIVVAKLHKSFPGALIGIALASICKNDGSEEITKAQKSFTKYNYIRISSNTDEYGNDYRYDGCHFNEKGAAKIGADYSMLLKATIAQGN